jgi:hypothetical protein
MPRPTLEALLVVLPLLVSTAGVTAQSSPPEEVGSRTAQIPGTDVAVTVPTDWRMWVSADPQRDNMVVSQLRARQTCGLRPLENGTSAEVAADDLLSTLARHDPTIIEQRSFETPVGDAVYLAYRYGAVPDDPRFVSHEYYVTAPGIVVEVTCSADEPPPDRWLSIIESMELAPSITSASGPFDPRIELPAHSLAIELPAEWLVETWPEWQGLVLGGDFALRAVLPSLTLEPAECWLEDESAEPRITSLQSSEDWRREFSEANDGRWAQRTPMSPGRHPSQPSVTDVDLPSGPGIRADWADWGGVPATAWVFRVADRAAVLFCHAAEPPADAWRSIAETFEFLPTEE